MNKDDWSLKNKKQCDDIHLEYYEPEDIETLRKKLINDCFGVLKNRGQTISGFTFEAIINKRFGVNGD